MRTADCWTDYELIDCSDGERLEKMSEAAKALGIKTFLVGNGEDWTEEIENHLK